MTTPATPMLRVSTDPGGAGVACLRAGYCWYGDYFMTGVPVAMS